MARRPSKNDRTNRAPKKRSAPDWAPAFLDALQKTGVIQLACEAAKIARSTFYERRDSQPDFAKAVRQAFDVATDVLEAEARRRALEGTEKPVFGSGGTGVGTVEVGKIREFSDTLMIFLLKAHRPKKFRERYEVKHKGRVTVQTVEDLSDAELAAIAASPTA